MQNFARRAFLVLVLISGFVLVWYTARVFLFAFAGILGALVLDAITTWFGDWANLRRKHAYAIVLSVVIAVIVLVFWGLVPRVIVQISQAVQGIPKAIENVRQFLGQYAWGRALLSQAPAGVPIGDLVGTVGSVVIQVLEGIAGILVIAVVAAYVGGDPRLYSGGVLQLFPDSHRQAAHDLLSEMAYTLRWWVLGQLVPMVFLGIATLIGLSLIGIPLVATLALFTGIMIFIPYIGSFIAFLVTVAVTLSVDVGKVPAVAAMFLGIHILEGYFLTPMVQKRAVYLPPALTILAQVLMGLLLGFLGLALATPLTAAVMVLVKVIYLREQPEHH